MGFIVAAFGLGILLELLLHIPGVWNWRKVLAGISLCATAFASGGLLLWRPHLFTVLLFGLGLYRLFNLLRIVQGRMHERYLRRVTLRTSLVFVALQLVVASCWFLWQSYWHETGHVVWNLIAAAQLAVAAVLFASTGRRLRRTAWPSKVPAISDADLPTLTVAIPARNETEDLQRCLETLVACTYPKLEILVLDDCSQTKRTPEIIRNFAHDGVRFIEGEEPKPTWLPKNQAYDHLLREASGQYILFCGVDVRFGPDSLRQLIGMMQHKKKDMLSLLPWRAAVAERRFAVVQAMRYFWELVPPRRLFKRPPVLSTCWIIKKTALQRAGGFVATTRAIVPEAHFARQLAKVDAYSFMRASQALGIESNKPAKEQWNTAVRMRYPQLHRRPESVFLVGFTYGFLLALPFGLLVAGFWISIGLAAQLLAAATIVLLVGTYLRVVVATRTGSWWFGLIALPFGLLYDVVLLHVSMWQYEFSTVDWKGRNVCIPTMHVIPHLPKIQ